MNENENGSTLILWDKMKSAITECHSVDEVATIRNQAEAYRYALKQAKESPEVIRKAEEIKLRAERRAGELLKEIPREQGKRNDATLSQGDTKLADTLEENEITRQTASKWQKIASIPEDKFENFLSVQKELSTAGVLKVASEIKRELRYTEINNIELKTDKKYRIIYADPPWKYNEVQHVSEGKFQETILGSHYSSMSISELCDLPVKEITNEDAVLFLWVTSPLLEDSFELIKAWGFKYKTSMVWDKVKHNVGNYVSVRHEFILICTKGSCLPDIKKLHNSVIREPRTEHSAKPDSVRELIDSIYSKGNKIELFARKKIKDWDTWGNEA